LLSATAAGGCAADAAPRAESEATGTTSAAYSVQSYTFEMPRQGGTGGSPSWPSCGAGNVVIGLWGVIEEDWQAPYNWLYSLGLICANLRTNGTLSPSWTTSLLGGYPRVTPYTFYSECPAGQIAVGIFGSSATYVDNLGLRCLPPSELSNQGQIYDDQDYGGQGGQSFWDNCPPGYAITYMQVNHGSWIDAVQPYCQYVAP
jgi:hypothetical protein